MSEPYTGPERRKRGRPPAESPLETFPVYLPITVIDRICRISMRVDKPPAVAARQMLERELARVEALFNQP